MNWMRLIFFHCTWTSKMRHLVDRQLIFVAVRDARRNKTDCKGAGKIAPELRQRHTRAAGRNGLQALDAPARRRNHTLKHSKTSPARRTRQNAASSSGSPGRLHRHARVGARHARASFDSSPGRAASRKCPKNSAASSARERRHRRKRRTARFARFWTAPLVVEHRNLAQRSLRRTQRP
jgi:hypothetical protein